MVENKPKLNIEIVNGEKTFGHVNNDAVSNKAEKIIADVYHKFSSEFDININLKFD
jgi:hypothetical protein